MNFSQRGSNFFKRASPVFSNLFQKARQIASDAPQVGRDILATAREGLSQASPLLGNVGRLLDVGEILQEGRPETLN